MFWLRDCKAVFYLFKFRIYVERRTGTKIGQTQYIPFSLFIIKIMLSLVYEANIAHIKIGTVVHEYDRGVLTCRTKNS